LTDVSGRRLALVVATDRYEDTTLRGLSAPAADAEALANVLGDPDLGGFEVDVLLNPTSWVAAQHVESLLGERHPSDLVLLHFSCHGLKDESGELFLAASNTRPTLLASTALDAALVNRLMRRSRAHRVVLLLDCCYGGAFERGVVARADEDMHVGGHFAQNQLGGGRGRVVITASSAMEYALEGTDVTVGGRPKPSIFTGALVEGLRSGEADRDQDGHVGLDELYDYVFDRVQARSPNQTPSRWEFGLQGDLYIARNPRRRIVPAAVSDEILQLAHHVTPGVRIGAVDELSQLASGHKLPLAAGAAMVLRQLADDDSRRVAEAATAALRQLGPTLPTTGVDLGSILLGSTSVTEVPVEGTPLALASSVETSGPHINARLDRTMLRIEVSGSQPGRLQEWVELTGPADSARIHVDAEVVAARLPAQTPTQPVAVPAAPDTTALPALEPSSAPADAGGRVEASASRPPQGNRPTVRAAAIMAAVAIVSIGVLAFLAFGDDPSDQPDVPAPFESAALYEFARPLFDADECRVPEPGEYPFAEFEPDTELVKCINDDFHATYWRKSDVDELHTEREHYLAGAASDSRVAVTEPPAGSTDVVDGVQFAYIREGGNGPRVYWDSETLLCAGELQSQGPDLDATIEYWLTGRPS
jgi:hypothetical protein